MDVIILGRKIGTASGWDLHDNLIITFYDFVSATEALTDQPDITIEYETGKIYRYEESKDHDPIEIKLADAFDAITNLK